MFHIVLVAPEIPQNTGTIGRLCVCVDARLHLIRPLGFRLDAARIRRAGLDYWHHVDLHVHDNWDAYLEAAAPPRLHLFTTHANTTLYARHFRDGDHLVFGNESSGLPPHLHQTYATRRCCIPMPGRHARSHNLANAVSIALYEGLRQTRYAAE